MGLSIGQGIGIPFKKSSQNWSSYWSSLISATVENAAPTNVVLTFPTAKPSLGASDFTIAGFTISSASWAGSVLTLVLSTAVLEYNGDLTITFLTTGQTATITNNVNDGNTVAWFAVGNGSSDYLTKDGSNYVSKWNDLSGNGRHLLQATGTNQPLFSTDQIIFDGIDNFLKVPNFVYAQPVAIYLVVNQITWTDSDYILSGALMDVRIFQRYASPKLSLWASASLMNDSLEVNKFSTIVAIANGASSVFKADGVQVTGAIETNAMGGITLASAGSGSNCGNISFKEAIFRKSADDQAKRDAIENYLINKYSL